MVIWAIRDSLSNVFNKYNMVVVTLHSGLRGRQEHHSMTVSDFQLKKDDFGNEFVTFAERITKNPQSGLHEKHHLIQLKMFSTYTSRCPVNIFKLYLSKCPSQLF